MCERESGLARDRENEQRGRNAAFCQLKSKLFHLNNFSFRIGRYFANNLLTGM